ncbi:MAG TPA: M48 family metalloprotease, partial [Dehalococcoidia bacterium]|nr:M48 family metalloprotease [Dehalococcoidia bacterium]
MAEQPLEQPVLIYDRIAYNRRMTWLLMLAFTLATGAFATLIGYALGMPVEYAPLVFIPFALFALLSYYSSPSVALAISGAREVSPSEEPELHRIVENLCIGAGLPKPKVYLIEDGSPNAFATGRDPEHAAIA